MPSPRRTAVRSRLGHSLISLLGASLILWWPATGNAAPNASATPVPGSNTHCDVPPRTQQEIAALLADPEIATPAATTGGQTLPEGMPTSAEAEDAIETVVRAWLACQNAGQPLRAWALFSDGYLYRLLVRQGAFADLTPTTSTPEADPDGGAELREIRGERELPDGRIGATVVIAYPAVPMPKTFFFTFVEIDGRLLIDGILGEISFAVP